MRYTLHSLKVTILSWGLQLDLPATWRETPGHHRAASVSSMVALYARDDVLGGLRAQLAVCQAVAKGWTPMTPARRGAGEPVVESGHRSLETPVAPQIPNFLNQQACIGVPQTSCPNSSLIEVQPHTSVGSNKGPTSDSEDVPDSNDETYLRPSAKIQVSGNQNSIGETAKVGKMNIFNNDVK